jgi:transposase
MSLSESLIFVGMDVHQDSVTLAVFEEASKEPAVVQKLPNDVRKLRRFFDRWAERGEVRTCYEASGAGYVLYRELTEWGHACEIIAPSLTPIRPGEQRKHDRRDAIMLARLYRAGELVPIRIPSPNDERVRDLVRCRETFQRELLRSRHYILKFLSRRGFVYRHGGRWGPKHRAWLERLLHQERLAAEDRAVYGEYLALMDYKRGRRDELDRKIEEVAFSDAYRAPVKRLSCFRGISTLSAMTLVTEIGDWRRFERPGQLMAYLGLVPREHSSGDRTRRGSITKAGNSRCRHILVQAAWHYRLRPAVGKELKKRHVGQPPGVIAHAWKSQHRLHKLYHRIATRKSSQVAVVAVARELVGFMWAVMRTLEVEPGAAIESAA